MLPGYRDYYNKYKDIVLSKTDVVKMKDNRGIMEILNRKAKHDYFIDEALECGIVLKGTEIKSIRKGSANLKDCYARIKDGEVFLVNMYIAPYEEGNLFNHEETRSRKLLYIKNK